MTFPINFPPIFGGLLPVFPGRQFVASGAPVGGAMRGISAAGAAPAMPVAVSQEAGGAKAKRGGDRSARRKVEVVMGIDFGTAFTKIAIRAPYEPGGMDAAHAVKFGKISGNPYMLPSAVWVDKDEFCWVDKAPGRTPFREIKVEVINPPKSSGPSEDALARAAAYLGLVIFGARNWFDKQKPFGANAVLDWNYHVGIPAKMARGEELAKDYSYFVNAAVGLAESKSPKFTLKAAKRKIWQTKERIERAESEARINLFPEVIAQAYGYARSPAAAEGIHAMVDIGAWTLDVCSFNNRVEEDGLTLHAANVGWRGCMHLHYARMNAVDRAVMPDQFRPLPQPEEYLSPNRRKGAEEITRGDSVFRNACGKIVGGVLSSALQWSREVFEKSGLPVIICGGGSEVPLFQEAVRQGWEEARRAQQSTAKARFIPLPEYGLIGKGIADENRHRFSVASGLSYPAPPRPYYRLNVPPLSPLPQSNYRDRYPGKEQM